MISIEKAIEVLKNLNGYQIILQNDKSEVRIKELEFWANGIDTITDALEKLDGQGLPIKDCSVVVQPSIGHFYIEIDKVRFHFNWKKDKKEGE